MFGRMNVSSSTNMQQLLYSVEEEQALCRYEKHDVISLFSVVLSKTGSVRIP
jgi:hypothetical protein